MSCILFRTVERHTVGEYFDLQTMKWLHQQSQLNLTWPPHRELLERCHRLIDSYFAVQDVGTLAAWNGAVSVLGLTNTKTSTKTTVRRICINTCFVFVVQSQRIKISEKKSTKFQSACTIPFSHTKNLTPPGKYASFQVKLKIIS
jgi:hypothetical protein